MNNALPETFADLQKELQQLVDNKDMQISNNLAFDRASFLRRIERLVLGVPEKPSISCSNEGVPKKPSTPRSTEIGEAAFTYEELQALSSSELEELCNVSAIITPLVFARRAMSHVSPEMQKMIIKKVFSYQDHE